MGGCFVHFKGGCSVHHKGVVSYTIKPCKPLASRLNGMSKVFKFLLKTYFNKVLVSNTYYNHIEG